jgi:hypothetical protein
MKIIIIIIIIIIFAIIDTFLEIYLNNRVYIVSDCVKLRIAFFMCYIQS